jgi:hypothetical protein
MIATFLIHSTLELKTLLRHCFGMVITRLIYLRSRISRNARSKAKRRAFGVELRSESLKIGCLLVRKFTSVLEQGPSAIYDAGSIFSSRRRILSAWLACAMTSNFVEGAPGVRQIVDH